MANEVNEAWDVNTSNMIRSLKKIFLPFEGDDEVILKEFRNHYNETNDFIRNSIYWMVRSEIVNDLVQEAFYKAWKNYAGFKKNSSFRTWVYRIAMNVTYDYLRRKPQPDQYQEEELFDNELSYEMRDLITKGLSELKPRQREVFILYYKLGHKQKEIAELLDISEGTVKSRLFHAKEKFILFFQQQDVNNG